MLPGSRGEITGDKVRVGLFPPARARKLRRDKHVESLLVPCLDEGSNPSSSTKNSSRLTSWGVFYTRWGIKMTFLEYIIPDEVYFVN